MAGALIWAAFSDLRHYLIPNRIPVLIAAAYAVIASALPLTFVIGGFLTGLAVLALGMLVFARGWMGGGDVKLMAAVALWAGPSFLPVFGLVTSISGALLALIMLSPARRMLPAPSADALELTGADGTAVRQPMPFGVAIATGGLFLAALYLPLLR
jgi:prepilin peptidase CpaA